MQVPFISPLLVSATEEFVLKITEFVSDLFGDNILQGGDIPLIIISCFTIMILLAAWRIIS